MGLSTLITLIGIAAVGAYVYYYTDIPDQIRAMMQGKGGKRPEGSVAPSGGDAGGGDIGAGNTGAGKGSFMYPGTGKTWTAKDSGKTTRNYASGGSSGTTQWDIKSVGAVSNIETELWVNVGGCGDEVSTKVFGDGHSDGKCCWLILNVNCDSGQFQLGGEGPHPDTDKTNLGTGGSMGSIKNKEVGIKLVVYKSGGGYTAVGYGNTGGGWKEYIRKTFTQWGAKKKSGTPASDATIQFRTDCKGVKYTVARAQEINAGAAAGFARAMLAVPRRNGAYNGRMHYLQQPQVSRMYNPLQYRGRLPIII